MPDCHIRSSEGENHLVRFNVGGKVFETTIETVAHFGRHTLAHLVDVEGNWRQRQCSDNIFVDRNPKMFPIIIDYLRKGKVNMKHRIDWLEDLLDEAEYYGIVPLIDAVKNRIEELKIKFRDASLSHTFDQAISKMASAAPSPDRYDRSWCNPAFSKVTTPKTEARSWNRRDFASARLALSHSFDGAVPGSRPVSPAAHFNFPSFESSTSSAIASLPVCVPSPAELDRERVRKSLINDAPSPPLSPRWLSEVDLGPPVLVTNEDF